MIKQEEKITCPINIIDFVNETQMKFQQKKESVSANVWPPMLWALVQLMRLNIPQP